MPFSPIFGFLLSLEKDDLNVVVGGREQHLPLEVNESVLSGSFHSANQALKLLFKSLISENLSKSCFVSSIGLLVSKTLHSSDKQ